MGATSVPIDEIAKTTREYDPKVESIDRDDSNCTLYATQLLMQIEMIAAKQSLTMKECNNIAATHGTPHARAEAGGKLIRSVMQWTAVDAAAVPNKRAAPPMPTLLGDTNAAAATVQTRRRRTHTRRRHMAGRRRNDGGERTTGTRTTRTGIGTMDGSVHELANYSPQQHSDSKRAQGGRHSRHDQGSTAKILRMLVDAFVAAVANG
jgi:hypothetical protein